MRRADRDRLLHERVGRHAIRFDDKQDIAISEAASSIFAGERDERKLTRGPSQPPPSTPHVHGVVSAFFLKCTVL